MSDQTVVEKSAPSEAELQAFIDRLDPDRLEALKRVVLREQAKSRDDEIGFECFYRLIMKREMPPHTLEWIYGIYEARRQGDVYKGWVGEAFRGSTKTTVITVLFTAWRIGKDPAQSNLIVQVSDDSAKRNTAKIADIIENHGEWKEVFPHVVPDKVKGWGDGGWEVKRDDMPYEKWREMNAERQDPTLLGLGVDSSVLIGKHPTGVLLIDDIHNERNTSSSRELENVRKIYTGTIVPMPVPSTWRLFVGTPWVMEDVLHLVMATGEYWHANTPVYKEADGVRVYAWPEKYGDREVESLRKETGAVEFARMYLLDLTKASRRLFKWMDYPADQVKPTWAMTGGCDYASVSDGWQKKSDSRDYFALAYVARLPEGGCVVVDGVLEKCTQAEAEVFMKQAQELWPGWTHAVVEGDGKGEEFIAVLKRNPGLRIIPMKTRGRGKQQRLEREMGPWLENGTVRISSGETPFLRELRLELAEYPYREHDDALDAVYWALRGMPGVLTVKNQDEGLPEFGQEKQKINWPLEGLRYI